MTVALISSGVLASGCDVECRSGLSSVNYVDRERCRTLRDEESDAFPGHPEITNDA